MSEAATHVASGKVRELYALDDERLLLVASDRISTFDVVLPTEIPDKGRVLTGLSAFWFARTAGVCANHLLELRPDGRSTDCRRLEMLPLECVVYVPSTQYDRTIDPDDFARRRDETAELLVGLFGGCRETTAVGRYRADDGTIIAEEVAVLTGFGEAGDFERKRHEFLAWLVDKREEWGQEALGFEFEGDLWYL